MRNIVVSPVLSISLIGAGAAAFVLTGKALMPNPELDAPLNVLGINRSPYGEVFAMAMQGPIDLYWHGGSDDHDHDYDHDHGHDHDHHHHGADDHHAHHDETCEHDHEHDETCEHDHHHEAEPEKPAVAAASPSLRTRFRLFLDGLASARETRTNPKEASPAQKLHIRRATEDKLRFAYQLDPAHYGNYNSYHFFLTEPQLGTRPQLTPSALKLARDTIDYCLKDQHDPRPSLTAAAACENLLELMFNDRHSPTPQNYSTAQMREVLQLLDFCLARHTHIRNDWDTHDKWQRISSMRRAEIDVRFSFVLKVREAHEKTIVRLESDEHRTSNAQHRTAN